MTIYISGPMSYIPLFNAPAFNAAAQHWREQGYDVFNPSEVSYRETWEDYMRHDIAELVKCETIYMLERWEESRGAKLEHHIAKELGMRVIYQ